MTQPQARVRHRIPRRGAAISQSPPVDEDGSVGADNDSHDHAPTLLEQQLEREQEAEKTQASQDGEAPASSIANPPGIHVLGQDGQDSRQSSASDEGNGWFNGTTMFLDRTCLYAGLSSDQDPHLLRHLVYDESQCFGDRHWTVWRVGSQTATPAYMTVFPNPHLDCRADMYSLERVEALFHPHQNELIRLYYAHVHPSYPVLEPQETLRARRAENRVPASLLAVIYNHGAQFWPRSPLAATHPSPLKREIRPWIFSCLTFEARTPNLALVQATLLFMQLVPLQIRAPNHPGFWPMTNMLVGIAQDIGLHIDPAGWNIVPAERKIRRVLWWAVYLQDKSMAHWLGRPSHIASHSWDVASLTLRDFSDDDGRLDVDGVSSASAFIALCALVTITADVSDALYSIRRPKTSNEALARAQPLLNRLQFWREEYYVSASDGRAHQFLVKAAGLAVQLSIQRAILGALALQQDQNEYQGHFDHPSDPADQLSAEISSTVRHRVLPILDAIKTARPTDLWLSFLKGDLAMIGSLLITLVLSSVDDATLEERRALLLDFRRRLKELASLHERDGGGCFEFSRLPLRRLNLIIEELFGDDENVPVLDPGSVSVHSDEETEEMVWASYQMSFN